jgi:hypothetical protein
MTKLRQFLIRASLLIGLTAMPLVAVGVVSAQQGAECLQTNGGISECLRDGSNTTDPDAADIDAADRVSNIVQLIVNVFSWIVGVIAVIMIIIGGLRYITSGGDSGNITTAKNTILYAIIGLIIVALAQIVVRFVIGQVTAQ